MASTSDLIKQVIAIDEEYAATKQGLSKNQDKDLQNIVANQRVQEYGLLGRGMNVADRMTSIPVRGNTDIVIENTSDKLLYTQLAKEIIDQEAKARERKKDGGTLLKGKQKKLDANKDGQISAEDFKMLQDLEKRNPKFLGGIIKKIRAKFGMPKSQKTPVTEELFLNPLPSYPNQLKVMRRPMMAEGGEMNQQMDMLMGMEQEQTMLPDEEMEADYVDYVVEETLSNEDRNYLIDALEKDDRLSVIFDQVVETAHEFSGSGTIEGPGTGKSDSIPARLSDGEFVITAKATEEIGEDNLMSMMKDAEAAADERQMAYDGGMIREEKEVMAAPKEPIQQNINVTKSTVDNGAVMPRAQQSPIKAAIKEDMMLDPYQRHVRS